MADGLRAWLRSLFVESFAVSNGFTDPPIKDSVKSPGWNSLWFSARLLCGSLFANQAVAWITLSLGATLGRLPADDAIPTNELVEPVGHVHSQV